MSIKTIHDTFDKTWFITFTCFKWIPLFQITNSYSLIYNWLNLVKTKGQADTLAFVIMPNHVHLLLHLNAENINLNMMISNAKRFMAYEMIKRLQQKGNHRILACLSESCTEKEKAKGQKHKVFELSFDAKPIYTEHFFHQKLNYIHKNPISGKWNLSTDAMSYYHSSALFYADGVKHELIEIKDYREVTG